MTLISYRIHCAMPSQSSLLTDAAVAVMHDGVASPRAGGVWLRRILMCQKLHEGQS